MDQTKDMLSVSQLTKDLNLRVEYKPEGKEYYIESEDLNRTGLPLAGYFEYFPFERIQIIGRTEHTFFENMSKEKREEILDKFFSYDIPVLIITRDLEDRKSVV